MSAPPEKKPPDFRGLPNITFRQLEVFQVVLREQSYTNAALELRSTRANIKRVCEEFEKAVGRPLFEEAADRTLHPSHFAQGLIGQVKPLSRALRRLGDCVRTQHEKGRILRFAAAGEFFQGGLFTDFLTRLKISDSFRPCFLRIETKRFRTALLNAECDVYFGVGISASDRLDLVNLGPIPWKIEQQPAGASLPTGIRDLPAGKWWIASAGEADEAGKLLEKFHAAGAVGGRILTTDASTSPPDDHLILRHDTTARHAPALDTPWPTFQFSAILRKHHPYSELLPRLTGAARA